jgi:hypothetical protein
VTALSAVAYRCAGAMRARPPADTTTPLTLAGFTALAFASNLLSGKRGFDPPPLKWSDLRYVFDIKEDCNGKEAIQA